MQKGFDVVNLHGTASGVIATPYIGENGNWWIGNDDTGISAQGSVGEQGIKGDKGDQGEIGPLGPQGPQGVDGIKGERGDIGPMGPQGIQGPAGTIGPKGDQGIKGDKGETGPAGVQGLQGIQGPKGDAGIQGPKGEKGDTGAIGPQGIPGEKGKDADESKVDELRQDVDRIDSDLAGNLNGVKIIPEGSGAAVKYYAQLGADAASKKLLGNSIFDLGIILASSQSSTYGKNSTFSLAVYKDYKNISIEDIVFMPVAWTNYGASTAPMGSFQPPVIVSYQSTTGVVTLQGVSGTNYAWGASIASARFLIIY